MQLSSFEKIKLYSKKRTSRVVRFVGEMTDDNKSKGAMDLNH